MWSKSLNTTSEAVKLLEKILHRNVHEMLNKVVRGDWKHRVKWAFSFVWITSRNARKFSNCNFETGCRSRPFIWRSKGRRGVMKPQFRRGTFPKHVQCDQDKLSDESGSGACGIALDTKLLLCHRAICQVILVALWTATRSGGGNVNRIGRTAGSQNEIAQNRTFNV